MSENKEEIFANFQSITGIDDIGEAFSHLEESNWDLMAAIQRVMPQEESPMEEASFSSSRATTMNNFSSAPSNFNRWDSSGAESAFVPVASTSAEAKLIDLTYDTDIDSLQKEVQTLTFNIHFNQQIYTIKLPSVATVGHLKERIFNTTKVPICRQAIRGWPPAKLQDAQVSSTKLCNLDLTSENELILIDLTEEDYMEDESDEIIKRFEKIFNLNIVQQPEGKEIALNISGKQTILQVKTDVYYITNIPVRHQEWTGWPVGSENGTTLAQSGIELSHNLILHSNADKGKNNSKSNKANNSTVVVDSDSSADEFEDASDFNACEEFFTDSPPVQPQSRHLIPNHTDDEARGSAQFVDNYIQRFGEPHPVFFRGSLEDALKEACHKPAKDRKLLAIYLHHGESILTNVFCDHLMKHDSVIQTLIQNFILYGWDLTFDSNKNLLLSSVSACVGNTASMTVRNIPLDKLPAILIIGKSRLSGRSTCEVLSVIHGNVGLDDLFSRLIEAVEMYSEHIQVEIREEDERAARDQVKAEQDLAYQVTLQADMAKEAAKRQKEAAIAAERQRLESEQAEQDAKKESIRFEAERALPSEPTESESNVTKIRIRKPTGEFLERKFFTENTLKDLLNFITSNGFLVEEHKVIAGWPRRDLAAIETNPTLQSLGLYPQETVILEER
ncbi:FAS-associated factor 1 isoform X1 [Episyrphus balteatus]|uniref:FAS-associated factor 1 isoform X1 n=1 Tax=Episyrphus balteatus TaxID=286459 RepID=UPI002485E4BE|nr:FAS-associated factor 1 isoform X1 [Episyrphus balteatus]